MISQPVIEALGLAILLTAFVVGVRFLVCFIGALRARRYLIFAVSIIGLIGIVTALSVVVVVWFTYAVAHVGKDASTDLKVLLVTVPPFFAVSIALWLLSGTLHARLKSNVAQQDAHAVGGAGVSSRRRP